MKIFFKALIAVCPVPFMLSLSFATAAAAPSAGGQVQNKTEVTLSGLTTITTGYYKIGQNDPSGIACGDFDEFNNINDPLFREGSKAFLRTSFLNDEAGHIKGGRSLPHKEGSLFMRCGKAAKAPALRDAPSDTGGKTVGKKQSSAQPRTAPGRMTTPEATVRLRLTVSQKNKPVIKKRKTVKSPHFIGKPGG